MTLYHLTPHARNADAPPISVTVEVSALHGPVLRYALQGDLSTLRIPTQAARPSMRDGLWRHTCFEAFIGEPLGEGYVESNFSPSGDWAQYAFSAPRVRSASAGPALLAAPLRTTLDGNTFTLTAPLELGSVPGIAGRDIPLGLSAVLESTSGELSYWALAHPGLRPDFHDRRGWVARLARRERSR